MNIKKLIFLALTVLLSLSLMACPDIINLPPEIVQIDGEEIIKLSEIVYEHENGTTFDPEAMLQYLVDENLITGIDYIQTGLAIGETRKYNDISDQIICTSFYDLWKDGDDTNFDGIVDDADIPLYDTNKTDVDGNFVYDQMKIFLISILSVDQELAFTLKLTDDEGDSTELQGKILIVEGS